MATSRRWTITPAQSRAFWHGLIVAGLLFNATLLTFWLPRLYLFIDAEAWWGIDLANLYASGIANPGEIGAFRYAPVIAWLFVPATWLTWEQLIVAYVALSLGALWLMTGRRAPLFLLAFPPVLLELLNGNIHLFLGLAVWAGLRWPGAWAFVLLTKVTPGVGMVWFLARREWRNLAVALGVTGAIVLVGVVLDPGLWSDWVRSLAVASAVPASPGVPPLVIRLPVAAAIAWFAGRTDRAWLIPVAAFVGLPIWWLQGTAILTACFPLYWERERFRTRASAMAPSMRAATLARPTESEGHA